MSHEIAEADFCFLPYLFEHAERRYAELSLPNKFEAYLAAGRPVLFHGPEYAGSGEAVRKYGVGLCLHSLSQPEIIAAVEKMINDIQLRESFSRAAILAFHSEFNAKVMMANFAGLIGIDPSSLVNQNRQ
jgi:hypothetical protein